MTQSDIALPWFVPSAETQAERERLLASQFFLVRIAGNGDVWRCKRCNAKHTYLTLMCLEQPFSGITGGLYAYWHTIGASGAEQFLSPTQRQRFDGLSKMFGTPELSTSHPQTARSIATAERDADIGCFSLGILEPITQRKAKQLTDLINARGVIPPLRLPGLEA